MNDSKNRPVSAEMQDAVERLAAAVGTVSRNTAAQNDSPSQPYFFHALDRQRYAIDHCGANWEQPLPARQSGQLAGTHRKAAGISAIAGLLMADHETAEAGSEEPRFTPLIREGLFLALTELAGDVHGTLSGIGSDLQVAKRAGGAA